MAEEDTEKRQEINERVIKMSTMKMEKKRTQELEMKKKRSIHRIENERRHGGVFIYIYIPFVQLSHCAENCNAPQVSSVACRSHKI